MLKQILCKIYRIVRLFPDGMVVEKKRNMDKQKILRKKIISVLEEQGFKINPHVKPSGNSKGILRQIQQKARLEQISYQKKFLKKYFSLAKTYCRDGKDITPENIELQLREVKSGSFEEILFRWWNFIWWSIPYQHSSGRQMRFMLWDKIHDASFGIITLQSPILKMSVRDNSLGIPKDELDIWVNRSMSAQRVGALPPYNELLGGKMVALTLTSNEIKEAYREKYKDYISIIKRRKLNPNLLFITTTSAFGKSSLYNRLKYNDEIVAECLGYTKGSGTFHIPEELYMELLDFLKDKGVDVNRGYGYGSSRKLRLISVSLNYLGLSKFQYHGIKREFYLFPLVKNLRDIIQKKRKPISFDRPFNRLANYWKERWAIPRSKRMLEWRDFRRDTFFEKNEIMLEEL